MRDVANPTQLVGEELSAVCFVRDYVEFRFDGPILRAVAPATMTAGDRNWTQTEGGYRNALCSVIGQTVTWVEVDDAERIAFRLDGGAEIVIPISEHASPSGESAHFLPALGGALQVW